MKKLIIILFVLFYFANIAFSQDTIKNKPKVQHTVFVELFGHSWWIYNIAYDCTLILREKHKLAFTNGIQYLPNDDFKRHTLSISPQISYLYGKKHHLEVGVGFYFDCYFSKKLLNTTYAIPFNIGYRYQRNNGGFFGRAFILPAYLIKFGWPFNETPFILWGGFSLGYTFKNKKL